MTFGCVEYTVHDTDTVAHGVLQRMEAGIQKLLDELDIPEGTAQHMIQSHVMGDEPASAKPGSVAIFTCTEINYPSRYFRLIVMAQCPEKYQDIVPAWAHSAAIVIAYDPRADTERREKRTGAPCFDMALLELHRRQGGLHKTPRPRHRRHSGYHGRRHHAYLAS